MKITVFGAAGDVGSRIVAEALSRGHNVDAVVRNASQFHKLPKTVNPCMGDAGNINDVVRLTENRDLVISAIRPPTGQEATLAPITDTILDGVSRSDIRLLIVGGAASLNMPGQDQITVLTADNFLPPGVMDIARACYAQHEICKVHQHQNWAYLSPPAMLIPGTRTGVYRLGSDELIVDHNGDSKISMEDFAVALLDEAEAPRHTQVRFTVAY